MELPAPTPPSSAVSGALSVVALVTGNRVDPRHRGRSDRERAVDEAERVVLRAKVPKAAVIVYVPTGLAAGGRGRQARGAGDAAVAQASAPAQSRCSWR